MARLSVRSVLLLAVLALLLVSSVRAFNPYEVDEGDDVGKGEAPSTSTVSCHKGADGVEVCESANRVVPTEAELEAATQKAQEEREAAAAAAHEKRRAREEQMHLEREAKRAAKAEAARKKAEQAQKEKKGPNSDDYKKIPEPLKKMRQNYYKFFGVEQDTPTLKLRKAINNVAAKNHPDVCSTKECKDKMVIINQARDVLLNDETRQEYDFLLRYGFKVYDKDLYNDMRKQYETDPENMPDGFGDDHGYDPHSDPFESMVLTPESAGWLLLLTGSVTVALVAWPVAKFYQKERSAEAKKAAMRTQMRAAQKMGMQQMENSSFKKKDTKYAGDREEKRFAAAPTASPKNTSS